MNLGKKEVLDGIIEALKRTKKPLTLLELVTEIRKTNPKILKGQTPTNTLYSAIYRAEKKEKLFKHTKENNKLKIELIK